MINLLSLYLVDVRSNHIRDVTAALTSQPQNVAEESAKTTPGDVPQAPAGQLTVTEVNVLI